MHQRVHFVVLGSLLPCVFVCVCSRKVTLIVRLCSKCLYPLNIFASPQKSFFTVRKLDQVQLKKTKLFRVNLFIDSLKIIPLPTHKQIHPCSLWL